MKRKRVTTETRQTSELLSSRLMEGKALHHTVDDSILRRRIRTQPFIQTAEKTEQLPNHYIDDGNILIAQFAQALAFDNDVISAHQFLRDILANDELQKSEFFLVQFAK